MDTEDSAIDNGSQSEEVEHLTAGLPHRSVSVFLLAFLVEAVDLGDLARLVVSADERDLVGVSSWVSEVVPASNHLNKQLTLPSDT